MGRNLLINERYWAYWGYNPLILKTITHKHMQDIQLLVKYDHFPIYRGEPFKKTLSWNHHLFARVIFFGWFCLLILPHTLTLLDGNGPQLTQWQRLDANRSAKQKALWYAAFWYIEIRWSRRCGSHIVFCPPLRATATRGEKHLVLQASHQGGDFPFWDTPQDTGPDRPEGLNGQGSPDFSISFWKGIVWTNNGFSGVLGWLSQQVTASAWMFTSKTTLNRTFKAFLVFWGVSLVSGRVR